MRSDGKLQRRVDAHGAAASRAAPREAMLRVDPSPELEEQYPALFELITRLHALPFELNAKVRTGPLPAHRYRYLTLERRCVEERFCWRHSRARFPQRFASVDRHS